jgi:methylated-DNA-protein-cysteine methyltransferase-like protein
LRNQITKAAEQKSQVWRAVSVIPFGKIATYGQIAKLAGLPGHARYVGYCLRLLPSDTKLPWHRVANAKRQLSFPIGSERYNKQQSLLADEGVFLKNNRHNSPWSPSTTKLKEISKSHPSR